MSGCTHCDSAKAAFANDPNFNIIQYIRALMAAGQLDSPYAHPRYALPRGH